MYSLPGLQNVSRFVSHARERNLNREGLRIGGIIRRKIFPVYSWVCRKKKVCLIEIIDELFLHATEYHFSFNRRCTECINRFQLIPRRTYSNQRPRQRENRPVEIRLVLARHLLWPHCSRCLSRRLSIKYFTCIMK